MRKGKNHIFAVTNAEVYKSPFADNSYIIFGILQLENAGLAQALAGMAQQQQSTPSDTHNAVEHIPAAASKLKIRRTKAMMRRFLSCCIFHLSKSE